MPWWGVLLVGVAAALAGGYGAVYYMGYQVNKIFKEVERGASTPKL